MKKEAAPYNSVMLIDDNEIDNFINQKMLESVNLADNIQVFSGGRSAFEYLKNIISVPAGKSLVPELIFLDIDMPMMDGFQFLEHFTTLEKDLPDVKFIVLTTSINPHDQEKAERDKRVLSFVNKPLTSGFLENLKKKAAKV